MREGSTLICQFIRSTSSHHRPWQIALAIALGVLLGVLPKTSLLFVVIGGLCFLTPNHLVLLVLAAGTTSLAAPLLEATLGRIGMWSLTHPNISAFWFRLDQLPLVPWLGLHNTVVHGGLVLGLMAAVPIFLCSLWLSKIVMMDSISRKVVDILHPVELVVQREIAPFHAQEIRPIESSANKRNILPMTPPVVIWDDIDYSYRDDRSTSKEIPNFMRGSDHSTDASADETADCRSSKEVLQRASDLAAWAEELISEELLMDDRLHRDRRELMEPQWAGFEITTASMIDDVADATAADNEEDQWLIETTMEVVRIAERAVTHQAAMKKQGTDAPETTSSPAAAENATNADTPEVILTQDSKLNHQQIASLGPMPSSPDVELPDSGFAGAAIRREQPSHREHRSHLDVTRQAPVHVAANVAPNRPREEALHYLLRHLKGIQEKAQKQ